jgi:hypothetical protein
MAGYVAPDKRQRMASRVREVEDKLDRLRSDVPDHLAALACQAYEAVVALREELGGGSSAN